MALPLPRVVADVEAGGPVVTAMKGMNALSKSGLENRFLPLETAIKAQNAMSYSSRTGNIGQFLRSFAQLPSAEKQNYLADRANRDDYMDKLHQFSSGINSGNGGNILTPEYIEGVLGTNVLSNRNMPTSQPSNPLASNAPVAPAQTNEVTAGDYGTGNHVPNAPGAPHYKNVAPNPVVNIGGVEAEEVPEWGTGYTPLDNAPNQGTYDAINKHLANQQAQKETEEKTNNEIEQSVKDNVATLTPKERDLYTAQMNANNKSVGTSLKNRADNGIAFDKFLELNRPEIIKVFTDAAKYNQFYGRAKNWLERWRTDQPESYANYIKAKNSLTPLMGNGIRFLEAMGVSHEAQEDTKKQVSTAIDDLDVSPITALKVFNSHMKSLSNVTEGVLDAAEPHFPGVRRKLAGIPKRTGDFIPIPKFTEKSVVPKGRIEVVNKYGERGHIPASQLKEAEKEGYKKVK